MNFAAQLNRFLEPIRVRIRMLVSRSIVSLIDDSTAIQLMQVKLMKDETKDNVERLQNYGFTSHPEPEGEAVIVFPMGNRDHGIVIVADDSRYRITDLPEGGVAMYHKDGHYIKMADDGIEINATDQNLTINIAGKDVDINAKNVNVNLETGGALSVAGSNLTVDA